MHKSPGDKRMGKLSPKGTKWSENQILAQVNEVKLKLKTRKRAKHTDHGAQGASADKKLG